MKARQVDSESLAFFSLSVVFSNFFRSLFASFPARFSSPCRFASKRSRARLSSSARRSICLSWRLHSRSFSFGSFCCKSRAASLSASNFSRRAARRVSTSSPFGHARQKSSISARSAAPSGRPMFAQLFSKCWLWSANSSICGARSPYCSRTAFFHAVCGS